MKKPNIVLIMTDEQRHDSMSLFNPIPFTPNTDSIANEGIVFENSFCASPLCTPARVSLFTGQYVHRNLAFSNGYACHIKENQISFPKILKNLGYDIGLSGKNHAFHPDYIENLFDYWEEYTHFGKKAGAFKECDKKCVEYFKDRSVEGLLDGPAPFAEDEWMDLRIAQDANAFIDLKRSNPFFLFLSFPGPHWPNAACEPYYSMYSPDALKIEEFGHDWSNKPFKHFVQSKSLCTGNGTYSENDVKKLLAVYCGQISSIDTAVGKVVKNLKEQGIYDDTVIIYTADHGNFGGRYGLVGKTGAFYEPLVRVPLIIKGMSEGKTGSKRALVSSIDIAPTILSYIGEEPPKSMQGESFLRLLNSECDEHRSEIYAEVNEPCVPLNEVDRNGYDEYNKKMTAEHGWHWFCRYTCTGRIAMIRKDNWKYCRYTGDIEELYNLENDRWELNNLAYDALYQGKKDELKGRMLDWFMNMPMSGIDTWYNDNAGRMFF